MNGLRGHRDIQAYSDTKQFSTTACSLCDSQENLQCKVVKAMLVK